MSIVALITWIITAGFGFFMLLRWATRGGYVPEPGLTFHLSGSWAGGRRSGRLDHLPDHQHTAGVDCVCDLVLVAIIGLVMVAQWAKDGRAAMAAATAGANAGAVRSDASGVDLAEQHIPRPPVVLHGIFAVSTVILVLLTALGIGGS